MWDSKALACMLLLGLVAWVVGSLAWVGFLGRGLVLVAARMAEWRLGRWEELEVVVGVVAAGMVRPGKLQVVEVP